MLGAAGTDMLDPVVEEDSDNPSGPPLPPHRSASMRAKNTLDNDRPFSLATTPLSLSVPTTTSCGFTNHHGPISVSVRASPPSSCGEKKSFRSGTHGPLLLQDEDESSEESSTSVLNVPDLRSRTSHSTERGRLTVQEAVDNAYFGASFGSTTKKLSSHHQKFSGFLDGRNTDGLLNDVNSSEDRHVVVRGGARSVRVDTNPKIVTKQKTSHRISCCGDRVLRRCIGLSVLAMVFTSLAAGALVAVRGAMQRVAELEHAFVTQNDHLRELEDANSGLADGLTEARMKTDLLEDRLMSLEGGKKKVSVRNILSSLPEEERSVKGLGSTTALKVPSSGLKTQGFRVKTRGSTQLQKRVEQLEQLVNDHVWAAETRIGSLEERSKFLEEDAKDSANLLQSKVRELEGLATLTGKLLAYAKTLVHNYDDIGVPEFDPPKEARQ